MINSQRAKTDKVICRERFATKSNVLMFRLPELIDEQARPDEVVEALHDWAGQEQHLLPLSNVDHLALTISVGSLNIKDMKFICLRDRVMQRGGIWWRYCTYS